MDHCLQRIYPRPPTPVLRKVLLDAIPGVASNGDSSSSDCHCGSLQHVSLRIDDRTQEKMQSNYLSIIAQ